MTRSLGACLLFAGSITVAHAADWTVDTTRDSTDSLPGDGFCADAQNECSLRAAVEESNARSGRDRVLLSAARYGLSLGDLRVTEGLDVVGAGMKQTEIEVEGTGSRAFEVLAQPGKADSVLMSDLEIHGGDVQGSGGAIRNEGTLTLERVRLRDNQASSEGGAVSIHGSGSLMVRNSEFAGNAAVGGGGAISNSARRPVQRGGGSATPPGAGIVRVEDTLFAQGSARAGGAIDNNASGAVFVVRSEFLDNLADPFDGGAVNNNSSSSLVDIRDSRFLRNRAERNGGAMNNNSGGDLIVADSNIAGNTAGQDGGGLNNNSSNGSVEVWRSALTGNEATRDGGGLHSFGDVRLEGSTVSDNSAGRRGGGFKGAGDTSVVVNNTLTGNTALVDGGGIFVESCSVVGIKNTIVADNPTGGDCAVTENPQAQADELLISLGHNIDSDDTCYLVHTSDFAATDPQLEPLADNGAPGLSRVPMASSDAVDSGDMAACSAFDQRGIARGQPQVSNAIACDIGSVERASSPPEIVFSTSFEFYSPSLELPQVCIDD